jgi:DNA-binding transcriptional regulator GbsR (MarR family)
MTTEERIRLQKQLVETIGLEHEKDGMQPVSSRILALLMVMDKECFTFDEVVEELGISKSAASVALKMLQLRNNVEYITFPGDRKRYFRLKRFEPYHIFEETRRKMQRNIENIGKILSLKANPDAPNNQFLKEIKQMMEFFIESLDQLKEAYLNRHNSSNFSS